MPDTRVHTGATTVRVRFFALYRELAGTDASELEVAEGSTVADLVARLRADPRFRALPEEPLVAVNRDYADHLRPLVDGDEVALIPPVSGG